MQQARGRLAVMVYTLVAPALRDAMRQLPAGAGPLLRPARASDRLDLARCRGCCADGARRPGAARLDALQADRGDRVRGEVRRRCGRGPRRGGHRARGRVTHLEDAAVDLPRLPRAQGRQRRSCAGSSLRSSSRSTRRRSSADDRRRAPRGHPHRAREIDGCAAQALRRARGGLRGARRSSRSSTSVCAARSSTCPSSRSRRRRCASSDSSSRRRAVATT